MTVLELQSTLDFYIHYPLDKKVYHCCWNCQFWCSESSIHFRHEVFHRCRSIARIINYIEKWSNYIGAYDKSISLHKIVLDIYTIEKKFWNNIFSYYLTNRLRSILRKMKCRIYLLLVMKIEGNNISNFDDILRLIKRSFYPLQNDLMMSQQKTTQIFNSLQFSDRNLIHSFFCNMQM